MFRVLFNKQVRFITSTRFVLTRQKITTPDNNCFPTFAKTFISSIFVAFWTNVRSAFSDYFKSSKSLANEVKFFRHIIVRINAVFNGGRSATTDARRDYVVFREKVNSFILCLFPANQLT